MPGWLWAGGGLVLLLLCLGAAGFVLFPNALASRQPTPTATTAPTETEAPTLTATSTNTATLPPTITAAPTATQTATPQVALFTAGQDLFCRDGPGSSYEEVYIIEEGQVLPALARWDNDWILLGIDDPDVTRTRCCWVGGEGELNVAVSSLELATTLPDRIECPYNP